MLEDIKVFCLVAKHKSFAKAARELRVSTSIVTRRVSRLEQQLDVRLLQRTTRQVTLTEAGKLYYAEVNEILQALEASQKNVKSLSKEVSGTLKIGLPVSISHLYVTQHLHKFIADYPHIKIHLINGNHLLDLLEQGFDLVIHCGELPNSSFHYKKLGMWEKIICASPGYLKQYGTPKKPQDLTRHNCLDHADNFYFAWKLRDKGQTIEIPVSGNIRVNSSIDLCNLAVSGLGITYLPSFSVAHELKASHLVSILNKHRPLSLPMYAVYPTKKYLNRKTQVFLDFLFDILK